MTIPCLEDFNRIKQYLSKDSIVFDVGSNVGNFSRHVCESGLYQAIYLFEPVKKYLNRSQDSLSRFDGTNFVNCGLGPENGVMTIYKANNGHLGWNTYLKEDPNQPDDFTSKMDTELTTVMTLDYFCELNRIERVDLVKIDTEGYECKVLAGFLKTLKLLKRKPVLYIEVGWGTNHPNWDECQRVYESLFEIGYRRVTFGTKTEDVLFLPNDD
jgi:FkbM family methyltransferase